MRRLGLVLALALGTLAGKPAAAEQMLFESWNREACGFTNLSVFVLDAPARVSGLVVWYDWNDRQPVSFAIKDGAGRVVQRGTLARGSCDIRQPNWCEAKAAVAATLPNGSYLVELGSARQCQNARSSGNGLLRIVGDAASGSAPPPSSSAASGAAYVGCAADRDARDMGAYTFNDGRMTTEMCIQSCAQRGLKFAATQFGRHCFCGNTYGRYGPAANCDMKCAGNPSQVCGGSWANSVYQLR